MSDVFTNKKRSEVMARIRSSGNKETELRLVSIFRLFKIRGWRRGVKAIGKPDFVFKTQKVAVFVDGCFWHGCPRCYKAPSSNTSYWSGKLSRNRERDKHVTRVLRKEGWDVVRIWNHQLSRPLLVAARVRKALMNSAIDRSRR